MGKKIVRKLILAGLCAAVCLTAVPMALRPGTRISAEAADSSIEGTVTVKYTVHVNQTTALISGVLESMNNARKNNTSNKPALVYNADLEGAAIDRAEDIALFNTTDGTRPDGTAQETVVTKDDLRSDVLAILTWSGPAGTTPSSADWTNNNYLQSDDAQSAAIGHVTYNSQEFYCIIISRSRSTNNDIGYAKTYFVDPVERKLSYSNVGTIYAASTYDSGATYSNPIAFTASNGTYVASLPSAVSAACYSKAPIPEVKYMVSTRSASGVQSTQTYDVSGATYVTALSDATALTLSTNSVSANKVGSYSITYTATVAGKKTIFTIPVTVTAASIANATMTVANNTYYANGKASQPGVTMALGGRMLVKDTDYTLSYANNNPATSVTTNQTATVTATGIGNYTGTLSRNFTIYPANGGSLSAAAVTISEKNITYDGKEKKPTVTVTLQGVTVPSSSYSVKYTNNIKAGTANIIVTAVSGDQRYTGTARGTFKISPAEISAADFTFADSDNKNNTSPQYSYTGADIRPNPTIKVGTETLKSGTDYTITYTSNRAIGTGAGLTITGKGNYIGTASANFEITEGNLSKATVTPNPATFTYNGQRQYPAMVLVTIGNHQLVQGTDYQLGAFPSSVDAGTYSFTITGLNNFRGTTTSTTGTTAATANTGVVTGSYTIEPRNAKTLYKQTNGISVTPVGTKTYTGAAMTPAITVTDDALGRVLRPDTDYTRTDTDNTQPGTAKISLAFKGNYTGTITISYKIRPKKTTIRKVTAGSKKATVTYSKVSGITGYQVKCGTNRSVTSGTKTRDTKKTKYAMNSLTRGKKYYFKVRTYYTTSGGTKVYSAWSGVKSVTVK